MNETLSDKRINASEEETINAKIYGAVYSEKDVVEFIQKLREDLWRVFKDYVDKDILDDIINKRAGSKFTDNSPLSKEKSEDKTKNWNGMMSHSSSEDTFKKELEGKNEKTN
jgi:hypothetical protein